MRVYRKVPHTKGLQMVCREAGKIAKPMQYAFLAAILLIAVFFRFYHLTTLPPSLGPDEAMNGNNAVEAVETNHLQMFYTEDNGREGLYVDLVALLLRHWPIYEPWVIRAPAAIAGVLTVLGLYLLVSELFGVGEGLIAAFLLSTSTWHITFSRQGLRAILAPLLLVWSMWVLIYAFCEFPKLRTAPRSSNGWWYVVVAGFLYGLGFYTYIAYRITPLLVVLLIASFSKRSTGFWGKMAVFLAVTLMTVWPLGWYFYSHPEAFVGRASQISVMNSPNPTRAFLTNLGNEALMFNLQGDRKQNFNGAPELFLPVGILFLLGLGACLAALVRFGCKRDRADISSAIPLLASSGSMLTLAWLGLGILPAAMSDEGVPHALRSILALPPAVVLAAIGAGYLYRASRKRFKSPLIVRAIAGAFFASTAIFAYRDYFIRLAHNPQLPLELNAESVQIGKSINELPASTPKYVIVNPDCDLARGIPIAAQTLMFITHSFSADDARARNIHYIIAPRPGRSPSKAVESQAGEVFYLRNKLDNLDCP